MPINVAPSVVVTSISIIRFCARLRVQHVCMPFFPPQPLQAREVWFAHPPKSFLIHVKIFRDYPMPAFELAAPLSVCYGALNIIQLADDVLGSFDSGPGIFSSGSDFANGNSAKYSQSKATQGLIDWFCDTIRTALPELDPDHESDLFLPGEKELHDETKWRFVLPGWWKSGQDESVKVQEYFETEILRRLPSMRGRVTCGLLSEGQPTECMACAIQSREFVEPTEYSM